MSRPRRDPVTIALRILDLIEENGEATRWDLVKELGNTQQFKHWVQDFLMKEGFVSEREEAGRHLYSKTKMGDVFHGLLRNDRLVRGVLRVSGKRLRRER